MKIFEYKRTNGSTLSEYYEDGAFYFYYSTGSDSFKLLAYDLNEKETKKNKLYLGYTLEEITDSPTDILGDELTKNGDPCYDEIRGVMPEITEDAYCFLSGAASHGGVMIDPFGVITPQESGRDKTPAPMFDPAEADESLKSIKPKQYFLDAHYPIMFNVFKTKEGYTELLYFVDAGDSDRDPIVWIREKKYTNDLNDFSVRCGTKEFSHGYAKDSGIFEIPAELFNDYLAGTIAHWINFTKKGITLTLPNKELEKVATGAMISAATTFTGPRPHYGHKYYGRELHDNFPPNYIWTIEAAFLTGHTAWAKEIFAHLINYGLTDEGKFCYIQGPFISGASAVEYAMILWLANRYKNEFFASGIDEDVKTKLVGMGDIILSRFIPCPEFDGLRLIKMCAEADNNARVNVYLNNNLWSIRGLLSLAELFPDEKFARFKDSAEILKQNISMMIEKHSLIGTEYGDVPPFRFNYPAIPYTLSNCKTALLPDDKEAVEKYFYKPEGRRDFDVTCQEITENTYANYRYYPEALSAMLLPENYAEGIFNMRAKLGGNLLGMTRLRSWLDDWPVANYARYLLETSRIDKYLLLLYSHTLHHGHPDLMCYYEQVKLFGKMSANDCVPSLLTTPMMTVWMFAYETVGDRKLKLLSALPKEWYSLPFTAKGIVTTHGKVDIVSDGKTISFDFSEGSPEDCEIVFRNAESLNIDSIKLGKEYVKDVIGNRVILKKGTRHAEIAL